MGTYDFGTQNIVFKYKQNITQSTFAYTNYENIPIGIYKGFTLSKTSSNTLTVSIGTVFIEDSEQKGSVRISTENSVPITVSQSTPYIIFRYKVDTLISNFMDMLAVEYGDILSTDIIVGRAIYVSDVLQTYIDYSRRSVASLQEVENLKNNLKVIPTEPYSNQVYINAGSCNINNNIFLFAGELSGAISTVTTGMSRVDIVYINKIGEITIQEGYESTYPNVPTIPFVDGYVLAKITRNGEKTYIDGNDIMQLHNNIYKTYNSPDSLLDFYVGSLIKYPKPITDDRLILCDGSAISRNYRKLFSYLGTTFGAGDGSTTFNIPNLNGLFLRGQGQYDENRVSDSMGVIQEDSIQDHNHSITDPSHTHNLHSRNDAYVEGGAFIYSLYYSDSPQGNLLSMESVTNITVDGINDLGNMSTETRPINLAVYIYIFAGQLIE